LLRGQALFFNVNAADAAKRQDVLDQIGSAREARLHLPTPRDSRLRAIADGLAENPGDRRRLADWAGVAGASGRTLARLFRRDTGMGFDAWRRQLRLQAALTWLAVGRPVTTVALDLGYDSPSAFIAMFRKALGTTPGRYFTGGAKAATAGRRRPFGESRRGD